jgi:cell division protein FtsB
MKKDGKHHEFIWNEATDYVKWNDHISYAKDGDNIEYHYVDDSEMRGFIVHNYSEYKFNRENDERAKEYAKQFNHDELHFIDYDNEAYTLDELIAFNKKFENNRFCKIVANIENGKFDVSFYELFALHDVYGNWKYIDPKKRNEHGFVRENNVEFYIKPVAYLGHNPRIDLYPDTIAKINNLFDTNFNFPININQYYIETMCFESELTEVKNTVEAELKKICEKKLAEKIARYANMKPSVKKGMRTKIMKKIDGLKEEIQKLEKEIQLLEEDCTLLN